MLGEDTGHRGGRDTGRERDRKSGTERAGSGKNRGKLCNNASYFVIEKGFKKGRKARMAN